MAQGIDLMIRQALSQIERPEYAMVAFLRSGSLLDAVHEVDHRLAGATMTVDHLPMVRSVILEYIRAFEAVEGRPAAAPEPKRREVTFFPGPVDVRIPPPRVGTVAEPADVEPDVEPDGEPSDAAAGVQAAVGVAVGASETPSRVTALREHITMLVLEGLVDRWREGEMSAAEAVERLRSVYPNNPTP